MHAIRLQRVHRLGSKKTSEEAPRPVIARFVLFPDREEVWQARGQLKDSNLILREDFPEEIERERRTLFPIFQAARKNPNMKAKMVANKLIINKQTFTTENLNQLPSPVAPRNVSEKVIQSERGRKYHLFQGRLSPFSNMHPSSFHLGGNHFTCVEQYYSYEKAKFGRNNEVAERILREDDPVKMKRLARNLVNHKIWMEQRGEAAMEEGLSAKFGQNPELRDVLLQTRGHTLVECNRYDDTWAIGVGLNSPDATDCITWQGKNLLGAMLNKIRERLN